MSQLTTQATFYIDDVTLVDNVGVTWFNTFVIYVKYLMLDSDKGVTEIKSLLWTFTAQNNKNLSINMLVLLATISL